jgi:O-antigen/teichoic acid export membrane protein
MVDQALVGAASFAASLILARLLAPAAYGGYALASTLFAFAVTAHAGLVSEPMMVFGSGRFHDRLASYADAVVRLHWRFSAAAAAAIGAIAVGAAWWGPPGAANAIFGFAVGAPFILLLWLTRRVAYVHFNPRLAAIASFVYMIGVIGGLFALHRWGVVTSFTAVIIMATASAAASFCLLARLRMRPFQSRRSGAIERDVARAHWGFGSWAVAAGLVSWLTSSLNYLILPLWAGIEANAALVALTNLVMPMLQANAALALILVPAFSQARRNGTATLLLQGALVTLVAIAAIYVLLLGFYAAPVVHLVYGSRYDRYAGLAWLIGLVVLPSSVIAVLGAMLRAYERPDKLLWAAIGGGLVVTLLGTAAVAAWGLVGAIASLVAGYAVVAVAMMWFMRRIAEGSKARGIARACDLAT